MTSSLLMVFLVKQGRKQAIFAELLYVMSVVDGGAPLLLSLDLCVRALLYLGVTCFLGPLFT
jgi:hypothetical protein